MYFPFRVRTLLSYDYTMRFIGYDSYPNSLIHIFSLSNLHNNVASTEKIGAINRVIVALLNLEHLMTTSINYRFTIHCLSLCTIKTFRGGGVMDGEGVAVKDA